MTCAPASINSATGRPSRAPSTTKSVISAMASGWLSLTPRSSRLRANMAAIEISNLSFSRGVRCMWLFLEMPETQQAACRRQFGNNGDDLAALRQAGFGHRPDNQALAHGAGGDAGGGGQQRR